MVERAESPSGGGEKEKNAAKNALDFVVSVVTWIANLTAAQLLIIYPDKKNFPNDITNAGFAAKVLFDACLVEYARQHKDLTNKQRCLLFLLGLAIAGADTFDGAAARACKRGEITRDESEGLKLDTRRDRESISLSQFGVVLREFFQEKNKNKLFFIIVMYMLQVLSDPGPSLVNAHIKSKGKAEAKQAGDLLGFPGTQIYRVLENLFRGLFPRLKMLGIEMPTVFITGALGILGNLYQIRKRTRIAAALTYPITLEPEVRQAAEESFVELSSIAKVTIPLGILAGALLMFLNHRRPNESQ
ncbi:MAG: hypothetical protein O2840_00795 [bacterium]|nr:hypothetical protein [bacterium]